MLESILNLETTSTTTFTLQGMIICTIVSLTLGIIGSLIYMYKNTYSKNFIVTLALLPTVVQIVIMLVNGNLGTGIAVLGAFSLVRFRSVPGSAREIGSIFTAMAIGLATGMGYIGCAIFFTAVMSIATIALNTLKFGETKSLDKHLKVIIPENLDYSGLFDDLFATYTNKFELLQVKTTNMGSLYELQYKIVLKDQTKEKEFIDELRCRNGNLNIVCGRMPVGHTEVL